MMIKLRYSPSKNRSMPRLNHKNFAGSRIIKCVYAKYFAELQNVSINIKLKNTQKVLERLIYCKMKHSNQ